MELNISLMAEICETGSAPGFEQPIRELVLREIEKLVDDVEIDNLGNVYAIKKGQSDQKVMVGAHMDEIGFIVHHIDDDGFLRFHTLGGFDPKTLVAQRVVVHGKENIIGVMGTKPVHVMDEKEKKKMPKVEDFFIDTGRPKKEVEELVSEGDPVTRERKLVEMGNCVNCKSIDNRISVFILIETLRALQDKTLPHDLYGVFTVQEELGIRGASVAAHNINPKFGLGLDTTIAFDTPAAKPEEVVTTLGEGTAIKTMDSSALCDYRMVDFMKKKAKEHDIKCQSEIMNKGGTDTAGIQRMGKQGAIAGAISIPTRNLHQVIEMAHQSDIKESIKLLEVCLRELDQYDWEF